MVPYVQLFYAISIEPEADAQRHYAASQQFAELSAKAEKGDANAQHSLGDLYNYRGDRFYYGRDIVAIDRREAVRWYRKAAEQNDVMARIWLVHSYFKGEGVAKGKAEAAKWLNLAAWQNESAKQILPKLAEPVPRGCAWFYTGSIEAELLKRYEQDIVGVLGCFDRVVGTGTLTEV